MSRISVVITTYNRAPLLQVALDRFRGQAFRAGDEMIVVDNGSTDDTSEVIERAAREFPVPLRHLRELVPGKTPALNAGIAAARGEVLALTDDDVVVADDWVAVVRRLFTDPSLALAGGRVDPLWERPAPRWLQVEEGGRFNQMASPLALLHYGGAQPLGQRTAVGANLIVRKSVHDAIGGFDAHLGRRRGTLLCGEDHDFCLRAAGAGYRCEYRPELRVRHRVPAYRTTLRYYLRWFFWSGVTNAMLEGGGRIPRYFVGQLFSRALSAAADAAGGRQSQAAAHAMDAAFALGNVAQRVRGWFLRSVPRRHHGDIGSRAAAESASATPAAGLME